MCDTIGKIIDKKAFFAKNSDRSPNEPQVLEWYPEMDHTESTVKATYIEIDQVSHTNGILLSRPTWMWGGEMGVNQLGVCIGNEAVFTKGPYGKSGLTGMDLVRLGLERGNTAKEALEVIIQLLERYGQGGNCGHDHNFFYDNGFLIMDRDEIYLLETAGKEWVYKKTDCGAISNRLSLGSDGDAYRSTPCDFAAKYTEPVYSRFSKAADRRKQTLCAVRGAKELKDFFDALRLHHHEDKSMCKASVGSPCMHYGGLVGDHTTQSMVVELKENGQILVWTTGQSLPCISIFKPYLLGNPITSPIYHGEDATAEAYWMEAELFHRSLLGKDVPAAYFAERDEIEKELMILVETDSAEQIKQATSFAIEKENAFIQRWKEQTLIPGTTSFLFQRNWKKKNTALGKGRQT